MGLLRILKGEQPANFRYYAGGRGHTSTGTTFGQRSIRYGDDRANGADSGQPYIQTPLPSPESNLPTNPTDFILRNGALGTVNAVATDESRLFKFFTDKSLLRGYFLLLNKTY